MEQKIILCDVDGVLADFTTRAISLIRGIYGYEKFEHDGTWNFIPKHLENYVFEKSNPISFDIFDGAVEAIGILRSYGQVLFVTSPAHVLPWCYQRTQWLMDNFGAKESDVIFTSRKELIQGDILIEDSFSNASKFKKANRKRQTVLIRRPYNIKQLDTDTSDIDVAVDSILEFAKSYKGIFETWSIV